MPCVFCRPERGVKGELNFESLKRQKWNTPMDRAQRVDEKNWGNLSSFVTFLPELSSLKWQKRLIFSNPKTIWKIFFSSSKKLYRFFHSEPPFIRCQPLKIQGFCIFFADSKVFWYFLVFIVYCNLNSHSSQSKHGNRTNDPIFSIYSLMRIRWYVSFLHFITFKSQFYTPLLSAILFWSVKYIFTC